MYVDSHCHLEMESFDKDRDAVIQKSLQEGLQYMLTVGTEESYFDKVIGIVDKYPAVYGAMGIHPHNGAEFNPAVADKIRLFAKHPKIVGYGEVGLDFFKNYSPKDVQIRAFREQLKLAQEVCMPIIVHSRSAREETLEILKDTYRSPQGGVIHCYSYDLDYAKRFLDMGFYISIPGTITYKNNEELMKVVGYIPDDRILAETDAPFLTPHPHRGKRNVPHFVKLTIEKMAAIRNKDKEELALMINKNFVKLFLEKANGGTL
ncbi:MAG: hydrolase TatD [Syntrophus sp. (in: bacteria)]|nr:hydrolase TatD [Syntrophus sp. (in: bacteria)]